MIKFKRTLAMLICMATMFTTVTALADDGGVGDYYNGGSGSAGGSTGSAFTWQENQSGYRITIVDKSLNRMTNSVDFLFSDPTLYQYGNKTNFYTSSRIDSNPLEATNLANWTYTTFATMVTSGKLGENPTIPSPPIKTVGGQFQSGGYDLKTWLLSGKNGIGLSDISSNYIAPVVEDTGTTRPVYKTYGSAGPVKPTDYTGSYNRFSCLVSQSYRHKVEAEAYPFVVAQGRVQSAYNRIYGQTSVIGNRISFYKTRGYDIAEAINMAAVGIIGYGATHAEQAYVLCKSIDYSCGYYFCYRANGIFYNDGFAYKDTNSAIVENDILAMKYTDNSELIGINDIPLAGTNNAYVDKVINYAVKGKYIFQFNSRALAGIADKKGVNGVPRLKKADGTITNPDTLAPLEVMQKNNFFMIVEPVFWFVPAQWNNGPCNAYKQYVYGTVNNIAHFYATKEGSRYANGSAYNVTTNKLGWRCMTVGKDWISDTGVKILGARGTGTKANDWILSEMKSNHGIAMHLYTTKDIFKEDPATQVTGDPSWENPARAPVPSEKVAPKGYTKEYNIVKYYEDIYDDGGIQQYEPLLMEGNPPEIKVVDEKYYKAVKWFTTTATGKETLEKPKTYDDSIKSLGVVREITDPKTNRTMFLEKNKANPSGQYNGEKTLVVLLQKKISSINYEDGPLTLTQSQISKYVSTLDERISDWGPRDFKFTYRSMAGEDTHYCSDKDCSGHSCSAYLSDPKYKYVIERSNMKALDNELEASSAGGQFAARIADNTKEGTANLNGGTDHIDSTEYQTVIWRGKDIPTIASFKESNSIVLKSLLKRYSNKPIHDRGQNGVYTKSLNIQLGVSKLSDLINTSSHSYRNKLWKTATHVSLGVKPYIGDVTVCVYRGRNGKSAGIETNNDEILTTTPFGVNTSIHSAGYMIGQSTPVYFYPYVRMTYEVLGGKRSNVNVLSQFYSEIRPNDFGEAAWFNDNENESLTMSSTQWSLHAKAVNGGQSWNGKNQVLPGGALYQLGTGNHTTKVGIVTWQTVIEDNMRNRQILDMPSQEYTMSRANTNHNGFVDSAKDILEQLRIVQWVNADTTATNAWSNNGRAVKVNGAGISLTPLGLSNKTSVESKYRLLPDGQGDAANQGDLDVIAQNNSQDTFFKVFSSVDGSIYMAKSVGNLGALSNVNGTNPNGNSQVTVTKILSQTDKASDVTARLTGEAKDLNDRTMIVSNLVKALERNTGTDKTANWVTNGHWYNEAFDGIVIVRKATYLTVGFSKPGIRTAVIDPKLIPSSAGRSDMFSKAYLSQFKVEEKSAAKIAQDKKNGFIGYFEGHEIYLKDMDKMYVSKKFYIPNVSVQDLN